MKALILAAGLGTRLRPLTYIVPKPMVYVHNQPCLDRIISRLKDWGIGDIMINTHHLPKVFMDYYGDSIKYSYEKELLGEEGTLRNVAPWFIGDDFFLINGDTLTDLNFDSLYGKASHKNYDGDKYMGYGFCSHKFYCEENMQFSKIHKPCWWQDIGTWDGLRKAKEHYENSSRHRI